jgi:hypothetical protein
MLVLPLSSASKLYLVGSTRGDSNDTCLYDLVSVIPISSDKRENEFVKPRTTAKRIANDMFLFRASSLGEAGTRSRPTRDVFFCARHLYWFGDYLLFFCFQFFLKG